MQFTDEQLFFPQDQIVTFPSYKQIQLSDLNLTEFKLIVFFSTTSEIKKTWDDFVFFCSLMAKNHPGVKLPDLRFFTEEQLSPLDSQTSKLLKTYWMHKCVSTLFCCTGKTYLQNLPLVKQFVQEKRQEFSFFKANVKKGQKPQSWLQQIKSRLPKFSQEIKLPEYLLKQGSFRKFDDLAQQCKNLLQAYQAIKALNSIENSKIRAFFPDIKKYSAGFYLAYLKKTIELRNISSNLARVSGQLNSEVLQEWMKDYYIEQTRIEKELAQIDAQLVRTLRLADKEQKQSEQKKKEIKKNENSN